MRSRVELARIDVSIFFTLSSATCLHSIFSNYASMLNNRLISVAVIDMRILNENVGKMLSQNVKAKRAFPVLCTNSTTSFLKICLTWSPVLFFQVLEV